MVSVAREIRHSRRNGKIALCVPVPQGPVHDEELACARVERSLSFPMQRLHPALLKYLFAGYQHIEARMETAPANSMAGFTHKPRMSRTL